MGTEEATVYVDADFLRLNSFWLSSVFLALSYLVYSRDYTYLLVAEAGLWAQMGMKLQY